MIRLTGDSRDLIPLLRAAFDSGHTSGHPVFPCVVGSPPYNVAIPNYPSGYEDYVPWPTYYLHARQWADEIAAVLPIGGRAWINVQATVPKVPGEVGGDRVNLGHLWMNALGQAGLSYRDTIVWTQDNWDGACAWGSWCQPSAPNLRGGHELILSYYKGRWSRPIPQEWQGKRQPRNELGGDWTDLVRNVWRIPPANSRTSKDNKPAVYPLDLPARCIRLSTYPGEWVLDPWGGHGTTGEAADQLGREAVLVDLGWAFD